MEDEDKIIIHEHPRKNIEIFLPDGRVIEGPRGSSVETLLKNAGLDFVAPLMGAIVNSDLRELTYPIEIDARVRPVTMAEADGARIYRRSLTFLLEAAFEELYHDCALAVDHSVSSGGFYCEVVGNKPLSQEDLDHLKAYMQTLVEADLSFERLQVPLEEAVDYFKQKGEDDKVNLLKYRTKAHLMLYRLGEHRDYHHGYMVPSTGYLKWFDLTRLGDGFVLRFPRRHAPTQIQPLPNTNRLLETFQTYGSWLNRLGIASIGTLNDAIQADRIREVVLVSEALQEQKIAEVAREIAEAQPHKKIVLIAGPSSSGKTTFAKRLAIQLLARGISPFALELDNYFVDREKTPKDEEGKFDFESLGALNTAALVDHLQRLTRGEEVQLYRYNFRSGLSEPGDVVRIGKDQVIILEGIHGLNPNMLPIIPTDSTFRIYCSCMTQLNLDRQNRISTTDSRLIRRIVRDARERGYSARQTIFQWESVRRGEKRNIFPYQEYADAMFNSALVFELAALKPLAEPLLRQVPFGSPENIEAKRLLALLEWFLPIDVDLIPDNSILREFIGGSILKGFRLWESNINSQ
ncbi:MAG: nucleoside kinase [Chloroflexi bacterium]|nr:nucleoside kinase [Chloroflexota bacterium]